MTREPGGEANIKKARRDAKGEGPGNDRKLKPLWYREDDPDKAAAMANQSIKHWQSLDQRRIWDLGFFAMLYGFAELGFSGSVQNRTYTTQAPFMNSLAATFNGCQSCVDTITNVVAAQKPIPQFTASDGDWNAHRIAKMRTQFIAGWIYEQDIYKKTAIKFRDSGVWGRGMVHVFARNGRAVAERVFPGDIFINQASCISNNLPLEMGRTHLIDRHQAWMKYEGDPEAQAAILDADEVKISVDGLYSESDDLIILNEMWRLPSYRGAKDGKHLVATTRRAVQLKPWKHLNFPFGSIDCTDRLFGYWPQGLVEQLSNLQLQYNDLSYLINEAQQVGGGYKLFINSQSNVVAESIQSVTGEILRGDGQPVSLLWELVQPELYERVEKLEAQFFRQAGISQMIAAPDPERDDPGASGIAIRSRVAINDERHALWTQSYQDAHITLAKLAIQTVQDILDEEKEKNAANPEWKPSYTVYAVNKPESEPIDFTQLGFKPDEEFIVRCMVIGPLPESISGRVQLATEFVQNGYYDEATARSVFLAPYDVMRVETLYNASREWFSKILDAAIEKGATPPDPDGNEALAMGLQMALQHLAYAKNRDVPESRCDLLSDYILKLKIRIKEAEAENQPAAAAAGAAPGPGAPLANPTAPPVSPLLPNPNAPGAAQAA